MKTHMHSNKALRTRLGWFFLIWLASVAGMGVAAFGMRLLMHAAGLTAH